MNYTDGLCPIAWRKKSEKPVKLFFVQSAFGVYFSGDHLNGFAVKNIHRGLDVLLPPIASALGAELFQPPVAVQINLKAISPIIHEQQPLRSNTRSVPYLPRRYFGQSPSTPRPFGAWYADLARAVRIESEQAVMRWWGVGQDTVRKWRRALGVGATTEGTSRLRSELSSDPEHVAGLKEIAARTAADPDRRAKIAAAKRGVPRPAHVREAMRQASIGRKPSDEARRKMSEAQRKRGARPPKAGRAWTAEEDALLVQLPGVEVARRTGRSISAVHSRRRKLKLPDGRGKG